jgi:hypothetical protein
MPNVFAAAIEAGIPVLTATRAPYDVAWRSFHGGMETELAARPELMLDWDSSPSTALETHLSKGMLSTIR